MSASQKPDSDRAGTDPTVEWVPVPAMIDAHGDKVVTLYDERGRPHTRRVAEMVLEMFAGPCPPGHELHFKDGDRLNCKLENLEWVNVVTSGTSLTSGPATVRPAHIDRDGRLLDESGAAITMPGLERDDVLAGLAAADAGRVRSLRDVQAERGR